MQRVFDNCPTEADVARYAAFMDDLKREAQEEGGLQETVEAGVRAISSLLPAADNCRREPIPASELTVALQCGGSDAWSGITANPALGRAADLLIAQGGTGVLGETTLKKKKARAGRQGQGLFSSSPACWLLRGLPWLLYGFAGGSFCLS